MSPCLRWLFAFFLPLVLVAAACGNIDDESSGEPVDGATVTDESAADDGSSDDDATVTDESAGDDGAAGGADGRTKPEVELPAEAPDELVIDDLIEGDGDEAVLGANVTVHYVGVSLSDGEQFDASWDRGQPAQFSLIEGQLIQGWTQGLPGMQVGGRRLLVIPPELGYGPAGTGTIAPNETLVFVIDLLAVELPEFGVTDADDEPDFTIPDPLPDELVVIDVVEGDGDELGEGDTLVLHFVVVDPATGDRNSSWEQGQPIEITLGIGEVGNPDLEEAMIGMKVGGVRQVVLPGDPEFPEQDPRSMTFVFVMELLAIR